MGIKLEKVSFSYLPKTKLEKEVFKELDLEIKDDKITAIIGPNGSGKTTLIELIATLYNPKDGKVIIDDFEIDKKTNLKKIRKNVGISFQFPEEQFFENTVYKEILFGMKKFNYQTKNKKKRILDSLLLAGLSPSYLYKNPFALSMSEKRKVTIASILSYNPKYIILDEPTMGLDDKSKENIIRLLKKLKENYNKTIIIVSHDVDLLFKFADEFIILKDNKVIKQGEKYEVFNNPDELEGISIPKIMEFTKLVEKRKNIKLGKYDDMKDLMKAVYRNVK